MACTTILVGKDASYDGSTIIARNEDSANGEFCPKRFIVVKPEDQPRKYKSVLSHVEIDLPDNPLQYTAVPNADLKEGIWGEAGVNEANVAMSATETLTTNERVLGADPFVELKPAKGKEGEEGFEPEVAGGIGEEDFLTLVLPYVTTAREGVERLGALLEEFGTYEMNGVAFSDVDEIWWLETVGGHHWIAKRVPDEAYVTMPNQLGIDEFDLEDAFGEQEDHMCSADLAEFIERNHLDLSVENSTPFNRSSIGFTSFNGKTTHRLSIRAPIGVTVRSITSSRLFPPSFIGESNSRLRTVNLSNRTYRSSSIRDSDVMCEICVCCVISK